MYGRVAVDRGLRLSEKRNLPCPDRWKWMTCRDEIFEEIMEKGFCKKKQAFVQAYENKALDSGTSILRIVSLCNSAIYGMKRSVNLIPKLF
jgi:GH15 family glucan-1,4-alpha-glucosidase